MTRRARCRLAIFDLDGTLIEIRRCAFVAALEQMCAELGYPVTRRELYVLSSTERMFGFAEPADRGWLELVFWDRYAPAEAACHRVPGALGALGHLHGAGIRAVVATARRCETGRVHAVIDAVGLAPWIDDALAAGSDDLAKTHLMRELCARAGCDPAAAIAIGDTSADIRAAREAGIGCAIAVCSGQIQRRVLAASAPDLVLRSVAELPLHVPGWRTAAPIAIDLGSDPATGTGTRMRHG